MTKKLSVVLLSVFFLFASVPQASAALLTFTNGGEIFWNVLSAETSTEKSLEITQIASTPPKSGSTPVALSKQEGKTYLSYDETTVDITGYESEIIEIEEKEAPRKISIEATEKGFAISQRGITAETTFPIRINSPENKLSVETPSGYRFLGIMPFDAISQLTRSKIINGITSGSTVMLVESEEDIAYLVEGQKNITLFKLLEFNVPINVEVSAISGEVVNIDQPIWYSLVGFLLA